MSDLNLPDRNSKINFSNLKKDCYKKYRIALKNGILKRSSTCRRCGMSDVRTDGHHKDYNKPLEVSWLCRSCHQRIIIQPFIESFLKEEEFEKIWNIWKKQNGII